MLVNPELCCGLEGCCFPPVVVLKVCREPGKAVLTGSVSVYGGMKLLAPPT